MTTMIDRKSFKRKRMTDRWGIPAILGSVEVTIGDETRRVEATLYRDKTNTLIAKGFLATLPTGKKVWPATIFSEREVLDWAARKFGDFKETVCFGMPGTKKKVDACQKLWFKSTSRPAPAPRAIRGRTEWEKDNA